MALVVLERKGGCSVTWCEPGGVGHVALLEIAAICRGVVGVIVEPNGSGE